MDKGLKIGDRVTIKDNQKEYGFDAGKEKTVTKILPDFGSQRAYALDGDEGIWLSEDFQKVIPMLEYLKEKDNER